MPREYPSTRSFSRPVSPTSSSSSAIRGRCSRGGHRVQLGEVAQVVERREPLVEAALAAEDVADPLAHLARVLDDVEAEDARRSRSRDQQRDQHLDRGRLAGAVRAEQPEQLAFRNLERDAAHRFDLDRATPEDAGRSPVRPLQISCLDRRHRDGNVPAHPGDSGAGPGPDRRETFTRLFAYSQVDPASWGDPRATGRQTMKRKHAAVGAICTLAGCGVVAAAAWSASLGPDPTRLPLGDGKVSTSAKRGYVYACAQGAGPGRRGARRLMDHGSTFDLTAKPTVDGHVLWPGRVTFTVKGSSLVVSGNGLPKGAATGSFPIATDRRRVRLRPQPELDPRPERERDAARRSPQSRVRRHACRWGRSASQWTAS